MNDNQNLFDAFVTVDFCEKIFVDHDTLLCSRVPSSMCLYLGPLTRDYKTYFLNRSQL